MQNYQNSVRPEHRDFVSGIDFRKMLLPHFVKGAAHSGGYA
jgi:hypothetical protein